MIRRPLAAVLTILLFASPAFAEHNRRDGNWWRELSETTKLGFVNGLFEGLMLGREFSYWDVKSADGKMDMDSARRALRSFKTYGQQFVGNVTNEQAATGLDLA